MLRLLSIITPLFPLAAGFSKKRNLLWWLCLASIATDLFSLLLKHFISDKISLPGNVYALLEFTLLLFFYKHKLSIRNNLFLSILSGGVFFFILSTTIDTGWLRLNRLAISVFLLVYIILSVSGLYKLLHEQREPFLEKSSFFWSNVAILLYSSGAFFLFLFTSHIKTSADKEVLTRLWGTLFLSLNILRNLLLGIALSKKENT